MSDTIFEQRRAGEGERLAYWEAGTGEAIVAILEAEARPTRAHALLAEQRRVIVFAVPENAGSPRDIARRIGDALPVLGIRHFDLMGEGAGAAVASWLSLMPEAEIGGVVHVAPDGPIDEAFREINRPTLVLSGTIRGSEAAERLRELLPGSHFLLVYDAGRAIGCERPEALAFIAREFFERRDLFLVSRESGLAFP